MIIAGIVVLSLVLIDQITKIIADSTLILGQTNVIIDHLLEFTLYYNDGASFGMLQGKMWLFMIITFAALIIFGYFFTSVDFKKKKIYTLSIVFLISGTLGNSIDRMRLGKVIDFLHVPILHSFGIIPSFIFNIADVLLNVGIVLFIIDLLFFEKKRLKANDQNQES